MIPCADPFDRFRVPVNVVMQQHWFNISFARMSQHDCMQAIGWCWSNTTEFWSCGPGNDADYTFRFQSKTDATLFKLIHA